MVRQFFWNSIITWTADGTGYGLQNIYTRYQFLNKEGVSDGRNVILPSPDAVSMRHSSYVNQYLLDVVGTINRGDLANLTNLLGIQMHSTRIIYQNGTFKDAEVPQSTNTVSRSSRDVFIVE